MLPLLATLLVPPPHATPRRLLAPPVLDGRVDDPAWSTVEAFEDFRQKFPDEGAPPSETTRVRLGYDDEALYVAVECVQTHVPVVARLARRDHAVESDSVEVDLDTRADGRSAFSFAVNAAGVLYDSIRFNDTDESSDWDAHWEAAVARTGTGWSVEMKLPLRVLRFPRRSVQEFGLEVRRHISGRQETDEWAWIPRTDGGEVSRYGRVGPFESLTPRRGIELMPFAVSDLMHRDAIPGAATRRWESREDLGLDATWHVREDTTIAATLNPDFAQVEADEMVLNLSTYETFFPEKRPFFLEGGDLFETPSQVLYTRRIGHVPDAPALAGGETLLDAPVPTRIWGAAKVTGESGPLTTAVLSAVTAPEDVTAETATGRVGPRLADVGTAFEVVRVKEDLGNQASLGVIGTAAVRDEPATRWSRASDPRTGAPRTLCPDGSLQPVGARCTHDAYVAGIDGRWRSTGDDWAFTGQLLGSRIENGPDRVLLDGTVVRAGASDLAGSLSLVKQGGEHWIGDASVERYGRRYDPNDLGYLDRQNVTHYSLDAGWRDMRPNAWSLERRTQVEFFRRENLDGLDLGTGYQLNERAKLPNFWHFFVEVHDRTAHFDDRELGNGIALERAGLFGLETSLSSDPRGAVVLDVGTATRIRTNGWAHEIDASVDTNLHPQLGMGAALAFTYTDGEPRFVGGTPGAWLFARQRAESVSATLRASWTFTPTLTLQGYAQLFAAYERFGAFSGYAGTSRVIHLRDLTPVGPPAVSPDFEEGALNANVVFRWEYRLGSTVYVVYSRSSSPLADLSGRAARLDLAGAPSGPAANAVLVKLAWWWG